MSTRLPLADEDGNIIQPPLPDSPVAQIIYLLEYGRHHGYKIGPEIQVGDVLLKVEDLRQMRDLKNEAAQGHQERTIWQEHGHDE